MREVIADEHLGHFLTLRGLRLGHKSFRQKLSQTDNATAAAIFIATIVFAHTIIYMRSWTWAQDGYVMAIFSQVRQIGVDVYVQVNLPFFGQQGDRRGGELF